ncbi:chromosome segregation protein SMC [Candidatus Methylacidithermus pantelleriae]|uniref:Chromosome partition protein Smc n=1 Tax=Candidatus Methylacidithermus pantelleriae TaxID=2744239 RepID=A0A8J2BM07_9BACT|nr:chromosome segregation protein SMC [Candidatus Methylacidithermus pantelleriae]CAF0689244.1 Chromosome partition protein Smc [Candidatus Methylacidithermus pantelleriae]
MYLERIRLVGFKSFADPTDVWLHPRLTTVVGPNGCGKSNLCEAIRWVLGEQSSRALRGQEMVDVIFGGTRRRPPRAMAEVSLFFKDCEDVLGEAYSELVLTRRVFRDGKGQYEINRKACRLRDIQWLFLNSGLGSPHYAFVSQQEVDRVLFSTPQERRELLEEAAGIARYRWQREDAGRRLEEVRKALELLGERLSELASQGEGLRRKAEKAKKRQALEERMRALSVALAQRLYWDRQSRRRALKERWLELQREEERLFAEETACQTQLRELGRKRELLRQERERVFQDLQELRDREEETKRKRSELERTLGELRQAEARLTERESQLYRLQDEIRQELLSLEERERKALEKAAAVGKLPTELSMELASIERILEEVEVEGAELTRLVDWVEEEERVGIQALARKEAHLEKLIFMGKQWDEKRVLLETRAGELLSQEKTIQELQEKLAKEAELIQRELKAWEKEKEVLSARLAQLREEEKALLQAQAELDARQKKVAVGSPALPQNRGGLPPAAFGQCFLGQVWQGLETTVGYERAIYSLLGSWAHAWVVRQADCLREIASSPERSEDLLLGPWVTFDREHPVEVRDGREAGSFVRWKEGWEGLSYLLANAFVAKDWEDVFQIQAQFSGARIATLDGWVWEDGGRRLRRVTAENPWGMEKEREELKQTQEKIQREQAQNQELLGRVQRELEDLESAIAGLRSRLAEIGSEGKRLLDRLEELSGERERVEEEIVSLRQKEDQLRREKEASEQTLFFLQGELGPLSSLRGALKQWQARWTKTREELMGRNAEERQKRQRELWERAFWEEELGRLQDQKRGLLQRLEGVEKALEELAGEKARVGRSLETSQGEWESWVQALERELVERREKEKKAKEYEELEQTLWKEEESCRTRWEECERQREERGKLRHELDLEMARQEVFLAQLEEEIVSKGGSLPGEAPPDGLAARPEAELQAELVTVRDQWQRLGPADPEAVEELQKWEERVRLLESQKDDLVEAQRLIDEGLAQMDQEARKRLQDTVEAAAREFETLCRRLLGGGDARIELVGSEDPLEAGIEIVVSPPGKRLRSLSLLSGGERALASLAFLFGLSRVRPSPVCVLDEVDASLDDANVERFVCLLQELSSQSQLLVITHHPKSVACADAVVGVTMEEPGVSKLIRLSWEPLCGEGTGG